MAAEFFKVRGQHVEGGRAQASKVTTVGHFKEEHQHATAEILRIGGPKPHSSAFHDDKT